MDSLNATFIHRLYDYTHLPEDTFGQRLKKLRLSMGLSQYELGNKIGMQHSMIGSYERDEFYPTLDSINKLSIVASIPICPKSPVSIYPNLIGVFACGDLKFFLS